MTAEQLEGEFADYSAYFAEFCDDHDLPPELFRDVDHVAIKCANADDYDRTMAVLLGGYLPTSGAWEVEQDGRRLGSIELSNGGLQIIERMFGWLEVTEPRPGEELLVGFVEHSEFVYPDAQAVRHILEQRGVEGIANQDNDGHKGVSVPIGNDREIKFSDRPLFEIVAAQVDEATCRTLELDGQGNIAEVIPIRGEE